jgi:hypothetical protein
MQAEAQTKSVYYPRLIPAGGTVVARWEKEVKLDSWVTKNTVLGKIGLSGDNRFHDVRSEISGKVVELFQGEFTSVAEMKPDVFQLIKIEQCLHKLVYQDICTVCLEANIKRHTQKIFHNISNISASEEHVEEKINELTNQREKFFLVLDLDNTIIHARVVPLTFDIKKEQPDLNHSDFIEVCASLKNKYLVRKRDHLMEFLEYAPLTRHADKYFVIFVYTFGTRDYGLEVCNGIDPDQRYLKVVSF